MDIGPKRRFHSAFPNYPHADSQPPDSVAMAQNMPINRAPSRASTASIHSTTAQQQPQHGLDQSFAGPQSMQAAYGEQWVPNGHPQGREMSQPVHPMQAGEMIMRPNSQLQQMHPGQSFSVDSSMQSAVGPPMQYSHHGVVHHHGLSGDSFANTSFGDDSQLNERDENEEVDSQGGAAVNSKPGNKTSANNELEMRSLFQANRQRSLQDVATELHGNERGPNSERTRQVFAMLWINQVCTKGKGSVPRGRVYANYASRCATERITVLNPASFGKLVRVLFPGLKTRRLGVRGESKYHYVNFMLGDDMPDIPEPIQPAIPLPEQQRSFAQSFNSIKAPSVEASQSKALLPSPEPQQHSESNVHPQFSHSRTHSLYNQPDVSSLDQLQSSTAKTPLRLHFAADNDELFRQNNSLVFPKIEPFLPSNTDPDAAMSLSALYRSHCTSLVECIRYCREKTFFHLYTSFQGTLTMPVQKLFSNPSVAPWIEQCDFILYQRMIGIVSGLTLQVVPKPVLDTLRNISERLVPHIRESFQGQPRHVVQAKEAPATIFAALLDRALRVNLTAHAAANMLSNPANRDQMEFPWEMEVMTLYGDMTARNGRVPSASSSGEDSAQNVLERWVNFLQSLQGRFLYATPEDIVWCVQRLGTEVMRDLTIAQGKSFGSWWVTKCWVDEMISFLAEQGGFMRLKSSLPRAASSASRSVPAKESSRQESQVSNASEDFHNMPNMSQQQPNRAPFPSQLETQGRDSLSVGDNPDDSGIGMRTPDEEFPLEKFDPPSQDQSLQLDQAY
ncbi:cephalosporin C regulator 1 [Apiospora phragmitis]|uniref:Cephalosporin C regulator 1 n=1 Tax=Apiospora phragmitis TaxID=2905665 RepID=A0ABR1T3M2_9PEZI